MAAEIGSVEPDTAGMCLHHVRDAAVRKPARIGAGAPRLAGIAAPSTMPAASTQARTALTGHAIEPERSRASRRAPPGRSCSCEYSLTGQRRKSARLASVERHELRAAEGAGKAKQAAGRDPASPFRSVSPGRHHGQDLSAVAGAFRAGALPSVRRIPRTVALTASELVGGSWPASLCA